MYIFFTLLFSHTDCEEVYLLNAQKNKQMNDIQFHIHPTSSLRHVQYTPGVFMSIASKKLKKEDAICFRNKNSTMICDSIHLLSHNNRNTLLDNTNLNLTFYSAEIVCLPDNTIQIKNNIYKCDKCNKYYYKIRNYHDSYIHVFYILIIISIFISGWFITMDHINRELKVTEMVPLSH